MASNPFLQGEIDTINTAGVWFIGDSDRYLMQFTAGAASSVITMRIHYDQEI